jgi:DNA-binding NarL/FixJ family response regulator
VSPTGCHGRVLIPAYDQSHLLPSNPLDRLARIKTIVLLDDHGLLRQGLRAGVNGIAGHPVHWLEASSLAEAKAIVNDVPNIDLILLDLHLPDATGLAGLTAMRKLAPSVPTWVLSSTEDPMIIMQALEQGASGFLRKSESPEKIYSEICQALGGSHSRASDRLPELPAHKLEQLRRLGVRHLEILELVLTGCSNREICDATSLSLGTVKNYVSSILLVFEVKSRSHLISLFH